MVNKTKNYTYAGSEGNPDKIEGRPSSWCKFRLNPFPQQGDECFEGDFFLRASNFPFAMFAKGLANVRVSYPGLG